MRMASSAASENAFWKELVDFIVSIAAKVEKSLLNVKLTKEF
jgi:hypothetical protein